MANETVIVGCKLPHGLILQVGETSVRVNGKSRYLLPNPDRKTMNTDIMYADGLTTVSKELWDAWYAAHKTYPPVTKGFIYCSANRNDATAKARETEAVKTGLEAINPLKPGFGLAPVDLKKNKP